MKNKHKTKSLSSLRNKLRKTLPEKIMTVLQSYDNFSAQAIPDDAKGFTAHHSACKSAVVHAETLLKLAKWTEYEDQTPKDEDNNLASILSEAREYEHDDTDLED